MTGGWTMTDGDRLAAIADRDAEWMAYKERVAVLVESSEDVLFELCRCCVRLNPQHAAAVAAGECSCSDVEPLLAAIKGVR
jgi:hypothetical protein